MGRVGVVLIAIVSLLAANWLVAVQILYIVDKIFPTLEEKYYKKQHIFIIGIFYSFYLRKKFRIKDGVKGDLREMERK